MRGKCQDGENELQLKRAEWPQKVETEQRLRFLQQVYPTSVPVVAPTTGRQGTVVLEHTPRHVSPFRPTSLCPPTLLPAMPCTQQMLHEEGRTQCTSPTPQLPASSALTCTLGVGWLGICLALPDDAFTGFGLTLGRILPISLPHFLPLQERKLHSRHLISAQ